MLNVNCLVLDYDSAEFVMRANVLNASTGYLIEAFLELSTGEISTGIWTVTTNILPYGGTCKIEDAIWGSYCKLCCTLTLVLLINIPYGMDFCPLLKAIW